MDKKLNRHILYKPNQPVSKILEERANSVVRIDTTRSQSSPILKVELNATEKSARLYKWLKTHPLINLNGLCKMVGADRANLMKSISANKELKYELLNKIINELKNYGYGE